MPLRVSYSFDCDECGHRYPGVIEADGPPAPPPGWVCDWGAYLCPKCVEKVRDELDATADAEFLGCVMCGEPVMERDALVCATHYPGR